MPIRAGAIKHKTFMRMLLSVDASLARGKKIFQISPIHD